MRKLLLPILALLLSSSALAQTTVFGQIRDSLGTPNELIYIGIKDSSARILSKPDGCYSFTLPKGEYTILFGGWQSYFLQEHTIHSTGSDSIELNIMLDKTTPKKIIKHIPRNDVPEELLGRWKINSIESVRYGHVPVIVVGMEVNFRIDKDSIGKIEYSDRCRGLHYWYFVSTQKEDLEFHYTYQPLSHTCELRTCDKRYKTEKAVMAKAFQQLRNYTSASYFLSDNKKELILYLHSNTLYLKRKE